MPGTVIANLRTATGAPQLPLARGYAEIKAVTVISTAIPVDDTIPQITEGTEVFNVTVTPSSTTSRLRVRATFWGTRNAASGLHMVMAAFVNGATNATAAAIGSIYDNTALWSQSMEFEYLPGSVSSQLVSIRVGVPSGSLTLNGSASARLLGGVGVCSMIVEEIAA